MFDINCHVVDQATGLLISKVAKRVLLDTGADINLISHTAFHDLGREMVQAPRSIESLAGQTALSGEAAITFTFLTGATTASRCQRTFTEDFSVVSKSERPLFDIILGGKWFFAHWNLVSSLIKDAQ